jgi:hypothetical protein
LCLSTVVSKYYNNIVWYEKCFEIYDKARTVQVKTDWFQSNPSIYAQHTVERYQYLMVILTRLRSHWSAIQPFLVSKVKTKRKPLNTAYNATTRCIKSCIDYSVDDYFCKR